MHNDVRQGPMANAIAVHFFEENTVDPKGLFYFIEKWIVDHRLSPTKMGGQGDKNVTYLRGKKSLEKRKFLGVKEQGVSIKALPPENKIGTECFDFIMAGELDYSRGLKKNSCILCWDDKLVPWERIYMKDLVKDLCNFLKPQYGYAFQREFKKGPIFYSWGTESGKISDQESNEIMQWGITGLAGPDDPDYRTHMIRDIYPLNFLSPQHLEAQIGSHTLQQWIEENPMRGTLEELLPDFWCWSVESQNIESVKESLKPHNILIAHMNF